MRFQTSAVLVTGACGGIGQAIARAFAAEGARVMVADLPHAPVQDLAAQLGNDARTCFLDVTNEAQWIAAMDAMETAFGGIDILVNNAGIIKRVPALEMDVAAFRKVIDVDLTGPFIMSQLVGKHMIKRQSGKIINICSMMSELGRDNVVAYASAKGGLKMLTKNLATEWAKHNIQVNGIGPGYFATTQTEPIRVDGHPFNDFIISRTPEGRWGNPEDLAGTAIFLASDASRFINGQIIYVDGGILATIGKPANE
jgi:gluconate 5-dehydrogenase